MIVIEGRLTVDPADRDTVAALMIPMSEASEAEDGCLQYRFSEEVGRPGQFRLAEIWESEDALGAHFGSPHMATFTAGLGPVTMDTELWKFQVTSREPLGG
jgi:quinol monooxygenase YgiN